MANEDERRLVVLYPSPGMGHLVSFVELGKLFIRHDFAVTVVIVDPPYNTGATGAFIAQASQANPSLLFHRLPPVELPTNSSVHPEAVAFDILQFSNPALRSFLSSSSSSSSSASPCALVVDFFCTYALDVAAELEIPCYLFGTSGAYVHAFFLYFPAIHEDFSGKSFCELGRQLLHVPGLPPIPADHIPFPMLDREDIAYGGFLYHAIRFVNVRGMISNTFDALEARAVEAIKAGQYATEGRPTPPFYAIGPIVSMDGREKINKEACLGWLNAQPRRSVVFLCFGSVGIFSERQLAEIAAGLEHSGQRFLWVVRSPSSKNPEKRFERPPEPDLDALLPDGFLARTRDRGLVIKSWAPQVDVLSHESVGGFVTHLGWNSVLEAVVAGVPMIGWPLYAEQRINKVFVVEEMRLAATVEGYHEELVTAAEVEAKVRWLMESEGGEELRARTAGMKEKASAALVEGGSSYNALMTLIAELQRS